MFRHFLSTSEKKKILVQFLITFRMIAFTLFRIDIQYSYPCRSTHTSGASDSQVESTCTSGASDSQIGSTYTSGASDSQV